MGRPRQHRDSDVVSLANAFPGSSDTSPDTNILTIDSLEQVTDIFTSVPRLTPALCAATSTPRPPWLDLYSSEFISSNYSHEDINPFPLADSPERPSNWLGDSDHSLGLQWPPATCDCMKEVHSQLSAVTEITHQLHSIKALRQSIDLAERVLDCTVCFNVAWRPSEVSGNVLLLGSLLSSIATCYNKIIAHQKQQAADSTRDTSPIRLFLGHAAEENSLVEVCLRGQDYRHLLRGVFRSDIDRLSSLCQRFTTRQRQIHENGHEECREAVPCEIVHGPGAAAHPSNACPRSAGPRASFPCLRIAEQVRNAIEDMQEGLL
ncbi:hypothetical protein BDW67DRAFT_180740 [Aspergillus spinulosporus]